MSLWFIIYVSVGAIVSIPLARNYWKEFRMSNHKANIIHPIKLVNRLVDSYVFMISWGLYIFLYPFAIVELVIKKVKNKKEKKK